MASESDKICKFHMKIYKIKKLCIFYKQTFGHR